LVDKWNRGSSWELLSYIEGCNILKGSKSSLFKFTFIPKRLTISAQKDPCKRAYQLFKCGFNNASGAMQPMLGSEYEVICVSRSKF